MPGKIRPHAHPAFAPLPPQEAIAARPHRLSERVLKQISGLRSALPALPLVDLLLPFGAGLACFVV